MDKQLDLLLSKHLTRLGVPKEQWPKAKQKLLKFSQDVLAIESDGDYKAANKKSSAKGGYQFLDDSIAPAVTRLKRYVEPQDWMDKVGKSKDARTLTPQQQELLFFGDILEKTVKGKKGLGDTYIKGIIAGDNKAAYNMYAEGHHTKPDARTNVRANKQFGVSDRLNIGDVRRTDIGKQDKYKPEEKKLSLVDALRTDIGVPPKAPIIPFGGIKNLPTETPVKTSPIIPFGGIKDLPTEAPVKTSPVIPFGGIKELPVEAPPAIPFGGIKEPPVKTRTNRMFSRPSGRLTPSQQNYYDMMEEARQNNSYNEGGTVNQAQGLARLGRGPDTELVHMTPNEVQGLQSLAREFGGELTTNPNTGLPEAGFLSSIMPMLIGGGLSIISGGTLTPMMTGLLMGGGALAASGGDLKQAAKYGLGGYSGAGLTGSLSASGASAAEATGATATKVGQDAVARNLAVQATKEMVAPSLSNAASAFSTEGLKNVFADEAFKRTAVSGLAGAAIGAPTPKPYTPESVDEDLYYPEGGYESTRAATPVAPPQRNAQGNIIPSMGEATYFNPNSGGITQVNPNARNVYDMPNYNQGGIVGYANGGLTAGPGDGMSDDIPAVIAGGQPAALSPGEFVVPADVVSDMGNGSSKAGARQLYSMMDRVRKARGGSIEQPGAINPNEYMPA